LSAGFAGGGLQFLHSCKKNVTVKMARKTQLRIDVNACWKQGLTSAAASHCCCCAHPSFRNKCEAEVARETLLLMLMVVVVVLLLLLNLPQNVCQTCKPT
jgi:hypothetical protein